MKIFLLLLVVSASLIMWAVPPDSSFVYSFGGDNELEGKCLAVDDSGYVFVGGEVSNSEDSNCFILVLDSTFKPLGSVDYGSIGYDRVNNLVLDKSSTCLVSGEFSDSLSFGSTTLQSDASGSLYLAIMASNGEWAGAIRPYGDNTTVYGSGLALDKSDNIFLAGSFDGSLSFGEDWLTSQSSLDIFLVKLSSQGALLWSQKVGGPEADMPANIRIDNQGNCYLAGFFAETVSFGSTVLTSKGDTDAFLAKLDKDGKWLWVKHLGATDFDYARSLALDKDGNCFVITESSGQTTLGSKTYDHELNGEFMLHKLDPNGNILWSRQADLGMGAAMAVDSKGNIFVTGRCYGESSYGDKKIKSNGNEDIYFLKLDPQGNPLWLESTGGIYTDISNDLVLDKQDNCYVTGTYSGNVRFGNIERTSLHPETPLSDIFVYKIPANK